ncbi:MAG: hypothetical protein QMD61_05525 [Methanobacterium sp.]|nr:hypothetical protein [Methanobacterium sp.]
MNKIIILILVFIVALIGISGCIDSSTKKTSQSDIQTVGNSTFQMPDGWHIRNNYFFNNIAKFSTKSKENNITLNIRQYKDVDEQNRDYNDNLLSAKGFKVILSNETISGVQTKVDKIESDDPTVTLSDYYFQKNGKYYIITIEGSRVNGTNSNSVINEAIETIISTLN